MDIFVQVFVPIIAAIVSGVFGFLGGRTYQIKVEQKRKGNNTAVGDKNIVGDGNEVVNRDKITNDNRKTEDKSVMVKARGKNSQAAGRDINNGTKE